MERKKLLKNTIIFGMLLFFSSGCDKEDNATTNVTDADGNVYKTVTIGNQVWMAENLRTTKYNDGTDIPFVTDASEWNDLLSPAYCWYNNDIVEYGSSYGALYNWYSVNTNKLCPTGWHIPTDNEWMLLANYLGGADVAGGKLKEKGTLHWQSPNNNATNETGFTGLPGGYRDGYGSFLLVKNFGFYWSSSEFNTNDGWSHCLYYDNGNLIRGYNDGLDGFSVRCVKD